jgi:hypothetical protein
MRKFAAGGAILGWERAGGKNFFLAANQRWHAGLKTPIFSDLLGAAAGAPRGLIIFSPFC